MPSYKETLNLLNTLSFGNSTHPKDYGIDKEMFINSLLYAKEIRTRFTLLQVLDDLGLLGEYANKLAAELYEAKELYKTD